MDDDKADQPALDTEAVGESAASDVGTAEVKTPRKRKAKTQKRPALANPAPSWATSGPIPMGARGEVVEELQRALALPAEYVTGVMDRVTSNRLREFQRANGLVLTGRLDDTSRKLLLG